jgi:hypothetical protein
MPFDVLGSTRITILMPTSISLPALLIRRAGNLRIINVTGIAACNCILNEEFLVNVSHHLALITSLLFVHTARRSYQWNGKVNLKDSFFDEI